MLNNLPSVSRNKSSVFLLVLALIVGGVGAQATGLLNTQSGGYLVCVKSTTKVVTHPGTSSCPKGSKKLVLGAQGAAGTNGLSGAAGLSGRDGKDGKDGKTLWNGVKDPESTWGAPGDMFINSVTKTLFGPKDLTTGWPQGVSMVGPAGATGATGAQGPGGASGGSGPAGVTGAAGAAGPAGATGATGAEGPAGANGTNATLTCAQVGTCALGVTGPGGGAIFYVATTPFACGPTRASTCTYLEAAPSDWNTGSDPTRTWAQDTPENYQNTTVSSPGTATATAIGWGYSNTRAIVSQGNTATATAAAALADSHTVTVSGVVYDDWYLPSRDELNQMCKWVRGITGTDLTVLTTVCTGGTLNSGTGFVGDAYWSSSELAADLADSAWLQFFNDGPQTNEYKNRPYYVRPVRAF